MRNFIKDSSEVPEEWAEEEMITIFSGLFHGPEPLARF